MAKKKASGATANIGFEEKLWLGGDKPLALLVATGVTFALRAGSMAFGWKLPVYRSRPPRV